MNEITNGFTVQIVGSAAGKSPEIPIKNLNEAAAKWRAFRDENGFGSREAGRCYIKQRGRIVAHVSYNGNVWAGKTWRRDGELLINATGLERQPDGGWDLPKSVMESCTLAAVLRDEAEKTANQKAIEV